MAAAGEIAGEGHVNHVGEDSGTEMFVAVAGARTDVAGAGAGVVSADRGVGAGVGRDLAGATGHRGDGGDSLL